MENTIVKCPNCSKEINVDDKFKKAICDYCGSSFLVSDAIRLTKISSELEKNSINNKKKDELLKELDGLIEDKKYDNCISEIEKIDSNDIEYVQRLLICKLNIFKEFDLNKLNNTDDVSDEEYWDKIREILKIYNSDKAIISGIDVEDVKFINYISDSYKKMIVDKELCERITNKIAEYYAELDRVPKSLKKTAEAKSAEYFKDLLGINMIKFYKINRDMTINYKHNKDDKHVYSRLSKFYDLGEVYKSLDEGLDDYKKFIYNKNNNNLIIAFAAILVIIALALIIIF